MKKLLLILTGILLLSCNNEAKERKTKLKINNLQAQVDALKVENDSLQEELFMLESRNPVVFPEAFDTIPNPEEFISEALKSDPELIPEKGVLGGKMQFINTEILNERFIWAEFEDGHINGQAIYQYRLSKEGKPQFRLISKIHQ
ncbi:MAG TPA: hypothetical protein VIM94_06950 [Salegentibacter sp.]|uniref:hypothetical protein n=1 Tax=Salegentibacter sp. TaxID=1903072 RepID=UPI002F95FEB0